MATTHLLAGDRKVGLGACSNRYRGIPVLGAPPVHFPHCEPRDCYCLTTWGADECARHRYVALSRRVVICEECKTLPDRPLTHGQLKHARDRARAARKRVIAARHSRTAVAYDRRLRSLNEAIAAATTDDERAEAHEHLRNAVTHFHRYGLRAA